MRKRISFIIAALVCLTLAQVGVSLWSTFSAGGERWRLGLYSLMVPSMAIDWLAHAIAIAFVVVIAVTLRHRRGFSVLTSFVIASAVGVLVIPFVISVVHVAAFEDYNKYHETYTEALQFMITHVLMARAAMVAHLITASLASMFGLGFGRHLTTDVPSGPSAVGAVATRALAVIRRLRKRDTEALLKAVEA